MLKAFISWSDGPVNAMRSRRYRAFEGTHINADPAKRSECNV